MEPLIDEQVNRESREVAETHQKDAMDSQIFFVSLTYLSHEKSEFELHE